ncbi:MAG: fluoride efflux transporter CrcB [Gammaproteobacteria bacterium]|nr:fluoride efflux transporter CrcB [Gammaproteobacteria bacterium]
MLNAVLVALGGALGALMRYWMVSVVNLRFGTGFPWGTLSVNVLGSFLIGVCVVLIQQRFQSDMLVRSLLMVGLLGGFTTFSAFSLDTVQLLHSGLIIKAVLNIAMNVSICLTATIAGLLCTDWLTGLYS